MVYGTVSYAFYPASFMLYFGIKFAATDSQAFFRMALGRSAFTSWHGRPATEYRFRVLLAFSIFMAELQPGLVLAGDAALQPSTADCHLAGNGSSKPDTYRTPIAYLETPSSAKTYLIRKRLDRRRAEIQ